MDSYNPRHPEQSSRKRSRSPHDRVTHDGVKRHRSRSPYRSSHHKSAHHDKQPPNAVTLPFQAHHLHKRDLGIYRSLFAEYLDIQKGRDIAELSEDEVKGRWKSFLGKWNRGELAEGWYDPEMKRKADERYVPEPSRAPLPVARTTRRSLERDAGVARTEQDSEDDDDGYGPTLPDAPRTIAGPSIPNTQDLQIRREQVDDDRQARQADNRYERNQDRQLQKQRLEDLAPRAEPGTRERQLEKKRDTAVANRAFRDAKEGGEAEMGDAEMMGGGEDEYKKEVKADQRRKNEREVRKEEVLRARAVEREERMVEVRRKEERTMEMLREIAKERFG